MCSQSLPLAITIVLPQLVVESSRSSMHTRSAKLMKSNYYALVEM
eukprot:XP_001704492.1 Hypothetical protein GL50803_9636 [Giardia lamblia ATCC 50803]